MNYFDRIGDLSSQARNDISRSLDRK